MEKQTLRRADMLFSIFLMLASLWYAFQSLKLFLNPFGRSWETVPAEALKETFTFWYKSPALMPLLVAFVLFVCALSLFHVARRAGAKIDFFNLSAIRSFLANREFRTFVLITVLLCVYAFVLIPGSRWLLGGIRIIRGFSFFVATFLYLLAMMLAFGRRKGKHVLLSFLVSSTASLLITLAFGTLARIPLP
ncbi:MAG: tripartite tricarboxylate transporter TctB family protein [Spirochaetes bacterium]|nr:tripartite tricarboxylate transporter TctB family protein [Spirochaetota bacterium]MBU0954811.1 tripartite tricarboxylate transporter TctB family protein [Spirochaetota bacterium]